MPRHTHPPRRVKHDRAHIRFQRDRYIARRWRFLKNRWDLGGPHPDEQRRILAAMKPGDRLWGPDSVMPPGAYTMPYVEWPFNALADMHPMRACSCDYCHPESDESYRARQKRVWQRHEDRA